MIALQVYCKNLLVPGVSYLDDARSVTPRSMANQLGDGFYDECLNSVKQKNGTTFREALSHFIKLSKQNFPGWFCERFDALFSVNEKSSAALTVEVYADKLLISSKNQSQLCTDVKIPFSIVENWEYQYLGEIHVSEKRSQDFVTGEMDSPKSANLGFISGSGSDHSTNSGKIDSPNGQEDSSVSFSSKSLGRGGAFGSVKSSFFELANRKRRISEVRGFDENNSSRKTHKYNFKLKVDREKMGDIEIEILSFFEKDFRLKEFLQHFVRKPTNKVTDAIKKSNGVKIDDPKNSGGRKIFCTAKANYKADTFEELSFLHGDRIQIIRKLGKNFYIGKNGDKEGLFRGGMVDFDSSSGQSTEDQNIPDIGSKLKSGSGSVLTVYLIDDSRKSILVENDTTPLKMIEILAQKLEVSDYDYFDLCEVLPNGSYCWLQKNIPLFQQGITSDSKLFFKSRSLSKDLIGLTDERLCYLYFMQAKDFVHSEWSQLSESEVIEFASLQLQAISGDYDEENNKNGFLTQLQNFVSVYYLRLFSNRSESWWQRKISESHSQHRGLSKLEAEKVYISSAESRKFYGNIFFEPLNHGSNIYLAIDKKNISLVDKNSKEIIKQINVHLSDLEYYSQSFEFTASFCDEKLSFVTLQVIDVIDFIHLQRTERIREDLRIKCRKLRDYFLHMNVETELKNPRKLLKDPEYFMEYLKNGLALKNLVVSFRSNIESLSPNLYQVETSSFDELDYYEKEQLSEKNSAKFIDFCIEELNMSRNSLFNSSSIFNLSVLELKTVLSALDIFFEHPIIQYKLEEIVSYVKDHREKFVESKLSRMSSIKEKLLPKDLAKRVADEILVTEQNYSRDLNNIFVNFVKPVLELPDSDAKSELLKLFGNIQKLNDFHQNLSKNMSQIFQQDNYDTIGKLFLDIGDEFVPLYESYCSNHADQSEKLFDLKISPEVAEIIGMTGEPSSDQAARKNLSSELIKPVQRIMRYHLLLNELYKHLSKEGDPIELKNGLNKMKEVASAINEIKRKKEDARKLWKSIGKIEGYDGPSIESFGELVLDGRMMMLERQQLLSRVKFGATIKDISFRFMLFPNLLMVFKEGRGSRAQNSNFMLKLKLLLPLNELAVSEELNGSEFGDDSMNSWTLKHKESQKTFILTNATADEKDKWVRNINSYAEASKSSGYEFPEELKKYTELQIFGSNDSSSGTPMSKKKSFSGSGLVKRFGSLRREPSFNIENISKPIEAQASNNSSGNMAISPLVEKMKSQLQLQETSKIALQQEIGEIKRQMENLNDLTSKLIEENMQLTLQLTEENRKRNQAEVELALEKGKAKAFEMMIKKSSQTSRNQESREKKIDHDQLLKKVNDEYQMRYGLNKQLQDLTQVIKDLKI